MAHGKRRRSHRSSGAAAGLTGPPTASSLHSVDTHPPTRHDGASIWSRRRVLLLNSTYEPLTALPMRRAIVMVICGKADVVHHDRFSCAYCGAKADTVDHVVPRSRGGDHSWENCVACCSTCNHRKGDKLLTELGWSLRRAPLPPTGQHWRLLSTVKELDPAWARYLGEGAA